MNKRTAKLLSFLKEIEKLKLIERQTYLSSYRRENDAEHSWHVAMFIVLFEKDFPGFNTKKMLKMALVHDLVEIYAGDTFSFDHVARMDKEEREKKAAKKLFGKLPRNLQKEFRNLFEEYENRRTKEAKLVQSFDKIQPILQGIASNGRMWKEKKITLKHIDDYKHDYILKDNKITSLYNGLLKEALRKKLLKK